jgi:hypothetical protein
MMMAPAGCRCGNPARRDLFHRSDRCYWNIAFPRPAGYSPISVGREVKELPKGLERVMRAQMAPEA